MFPPLASNQDCDTYEAPDAIRYALTPPHHHITATDALARAIGHDDNYESDGYGAAASYYVLDPTDARIYSLSFAQIHGSLDLANRVQPGTYVYVRSDDRGFWDAIFFDTEDEAEAALQSWTAENVPTYCDECETDLPPTNYAPTSGLCERCETIRLCGHYGANDRDERIDGRCVQCHPNGGLLDEILYAER